MVKSLENVWVQFGKKRTEVKEVGRTGLSNGFALRPFLDSFPGRLAVA